MKIIRYLAILLFLVFTDTQAAVIRVTTTADTSATLCSLRDAILSAEFDSAYGGCDPGFGEDEIQVGSGLYVVTNKGVTSSSQPVLPLITTTIRIVGKGAVIQQAGDDRQSNNPLLQVSPTGDLTGEGFIIEGAKGQGLVVDGGRATLKNVKITKSRVGNVVSWNGAIVTFFDSEISHGFNGAQGYVGGVDIQNGSSLYLYHCVIKNNAGGVGEFLVRQKNDAVSTIHIENSMLSHNNSRYEAAIDASNAQLVLLDSTVRENRAPYLSAIHVGPHPALISNTLIVDNSTVFGWAGGIHAGAKTRIENSTVRGNRCDDCVVGGVYAVEGAEIVNTAVLENVGVYHAGGIVTKGKVTVRNCTIAGNTVKPHFPDVEKKKRISGGIASTVDPNAFADPILMQNTIVADNIGGHWECAEDLLDGSTHNFVSDGSCNAQYAGAFSPFDRAAIDETEPVRYWPLRADHIAASGGDVRSCTESDMLGVNRLEDGVCSLGSVEYRTSHSEPPPGDGGNSGPIGGGGSAGGGGANGGNGSSGGSGSTAGGGSTDVLADNGDRSGNKSKSSGGGALSIPFSLLLIGMRAGVRRRRAKY